MCVCVCVVYVYVWCMCVCDQGQPTSLDQPFLVRRGCENNLGRGGSSMRVGWCKLFPGTPGPDWLEPEGPWYPWPRTSHAGSVPVSKWPSGEVSMVPSGCQESPRCSKTTSSRPFGLNAPTSSIPHHAYRALKEGASKVVRLLWVPLFPFPLMLSKYWCSLHFYSVVFFKLSYIWVYTICRILNLISFT